jgi:hypothetical protein
MEKVYSEASLQEAIAKLELRQAEEGFLLKEQFHQTYESVKPASLIKTILKQAVGSAEIKDNLVSTSVGLTAGYLSKLLFQGLTRNPVKKLIGTALMFGITNVVAKNPETVKVLGHKFFQLFRKKST